MSVQCPHCNGVIESDPSLAGQELTCPNCNGVFTVPGSPFDFVKDKAASTAQSAKSAADRLRKKKHYTPKEMIAGLGVVFLLGCFCMCGLGALFNGDEAGDGSGGLPSPANGNPNSPFHSGATKANFINKLTSIMTNGSYEPRYNVCHVICDYDTFIGTFGEPDSDSEGPDFDRYWGYDCSDGSLILTVTAAGDLVVITAIDKY